MATKAYRSRVLEWSSCDWRLLKVAMSTKEENFGINREKDLKYNFTPSNGPGRNKVATPGG